MKKQKEIQTSIQIIILCIAIVLIIALTGTNFYFKDTWKEKFVEVNGCQTIKNIYQSSIEVFCNVPSTGMCYGGSLGNCDGEVFYGTLSNEVGNPKSDDIRICGLGKCTIRYKTKSLSIKSDIFK